MRFVLSKELRRGMRLARPVYNKSGVLLYDVNTKLTRNVVNSINNFGLLGAYILEPTEPAAILTEEDRAFEQFQAMTLFALKDQLDKMVKHEGVQNIDSLAKKIIDSYGHSKKKINFLKNLRSPEDYAYKHSLSVAILCALISSQMNMSYMEQVNVVSAALLHEIGRVMVPESILRKGAAVDKDDAVTISKCEIEGNELIQHDLNIPSLTRIMIAQNTKEIGGKNKKEAKLLDGTKVLRVADVFDTMTSMGINAEPYSDVVAVRYLLENKEMFDEKTVGAFLKSINILIPGVCVVLTNGQKGLVIRENEENILRPMVLGFGDNKIYNLLDDSVYQKIKISDVLKSMDNRVPITQEAIQNFQATAN